MSSQNIKQYLLLFLSLFISLGGVFSQSWETKASLPVAVVQHAAAVDPATELIYIFGGLGPTCGANQYSTVSIYNPSTNAWTNGTSMPTASRGLSAVTHSDGSIYVGGGVSNTFYKYVPSGAGGTFTSLSLPSGGLKWKGAMAISNGFIYYFAGENSSQAAYKYSIANNTWSSIANVPAGITFGHSAVPDDNGNIWIFGGRIDYNAANSQKVFKYNLAANTYRLYICCGR